MKKLGLLLIAFAFIFTSCSKDDDNGSHDPFIGTWKFHQYFENDVEIPIVGCEAQETIVVSENGDFSNSFFDEDENGVCEQIFQISGTWENIGNGNYAITLEGDTETVQVFFEENTFYVIDSYEFDGETYNDKYVYIRI